MIEEIKKEIKNLYFKTDDGCSFLYEINKLLDKYKDQDKYKQMYEKLCKYVIGMDSDYSIWIDELEKEFKLGDE